MPLVGATVILETLIRTGYKHVPVGFLWKIEIGTEHHLSPILSFTSSG
jgi:hypothetical protein